MRTILLLINNVSYMINNCKHLIAYQFNDLLLLILSYKQIDPRPKKPN